jgi:two-component system nitrogen regulation response regulator NtrX
LITGESGTGKEMVARSIHFNSARKTGPFVAINCAAIPEGLLETELFGHLKGAFTGAVSNRIGRFAQAHGGTLFLDEVGDMPVATQAKILRVLQEQRFVRPGGDTRVEVDVRVIASSSKELKGEMAAGRFREDLFYRLSVVPLAMPPLAERRIDIPELARHFMTGAARHAGLPPRPITEEAMAVLQTGEWPGDVRQLRNTIEWMLIMAPGDPGTPVGVDGLPPELTNSATGHMDPMANGELVSMPLREAREHFERAYLQAQLQRFGGNISRTANFVGMERSALHRKLKTLGLHGDE